ncbi:hypothetical protein DL98DRAFT_620539 [Cadophora sp. DSE1049]|nr:hypothetical protein DL98DRAFT_620539 [Cadophora sp. DSE1049]
MEPSIITGASPGTSIQSHITNDDFTGDELSTIGNFDPNSNNEFPKVSKQSSSAWELWFFDAVSEAGDAAVTFSFYRDGSGPSIGKAPLRTSFHAVMADGSVFGKDFAANDSLFESGLENLSGTWSAGDQSARFRITQDLTEAVVKFDTADIRGNFTFHSAAGKYQPSAIQDTSTASDLGSKFLLAPTIHWLQPIVQATVTAEFYVDGKVVQFKGVGGHDRFFTPFSWTTLMDESYYVRASAGPYTIVMLRIISRIDVGRPHGKVLLVKSGQEIFCTQNEDIALQGDFFSFKLCYHAGVKGAFQNANTGYTIDLVSPMKGKHWRFAMDHKKVWWNMPTGPVTGNTGFLDEVVAGEVGGEQYKGVGSAGQCQLAAIKK